jgi:DNA-binding XRE family transcriptional regulator
MANRTKHVQPFSGPEKAFGSAFRTMRKRLRVSQEKVSLEADCDRTTISLIERGLVSPKLSTIVKMCRVLAIKPSEVMRRMEKSPYYRA